MKAQRTCEPTGTPFLPSRQHYPATGRAGRARLAATYQSSPGGHQAVTGHIQPTAAGLGCQSHIGRLAAGGVTIASHDWLFLVGALSILAIRYGAAYLLIRSIKDDQASYEIKTPFIFIKKIPSRAGKSSESPSQNVNQSGQLSTTTAPDNQVSHT